MANRYSWALRALGWLVLAGFCLLGATVAPAQSGPPVITAQPQSLTNRAGTYPVFTVSATGEQPLGYQWYKDGEALGPGGWSGQSTDMLTINYARKTNEGQYYVVVSNSVGTMTSSNAALTVLDPAISVQPAHQYVWPRAIASLSVTPAGTPPYRYQWRFQGSPIATATNSFVFVYGAETNAGPYDAIVSNLYGSATSAAAVVTVNLSAIDNWVADANAAVYATAVQDDGRLVAGGSFTAVGNYTRNRIARIRADGALDTQFNPNANGDVYCLLALPDGKLMVGGAFTSLGGRTCNYLGRLNEDGTLDTNFTAAVSGTIYCLAWQEDGQILAGGVNRLLRIGTNGVVDATFNPAVIGTIYAVVAQELNPAVGTGIVVGGNFLAIAGGGRQNLARLGFNGQLDNYFTSPVSGTIYAMAGLPGGGVVLGGQFSKIGQMPRANLARLDVLGVLADRFNPGASNTVYSLTLQADGKLLVGGAFTTLAGVQRSYLGRLDADGSIDPVFNPPANQLIYSLAVQADGRLVAGGLFTSFGNAPRKCLARLAASNDATQALTAADGKVTWMRGGALPYVRDVSFDYYAAGNGWVSLAPGQPIAGGWQAAASVPAGATLRARGKAACGRGGGSGSMIQYSAGPAVILTQPVGRYITAPTSTILSVEAAGSGPFTYQWFRNGAPLVNETNSAYLYASTGSYMVTVCNPFGCVQSEVATIWRINLVESAARPNPSLSVSALSVQPDGKVLLGGNFPTVWGTPRQGLARLNVDGSLDTNFDASVGGTVLCLAVQPDGQILLGGTFTNVGGLSRYGLARVNEDGTPDSGFIANATGGAPGAGVYSLSLQNDGRILVGGSFGIISGENRSCLARLESTGAVDPGFVPGVNLHPNRQVNSILQMPNGLLMLGGCFSSGGAYESYEWVQSNGSYAGSGFAAPLGAPSVVYALLAQADGQVLLGGYDVRVDAQIGRTLARLNTDRSPDAGFTANADGPVFCLAAQPDGKVLVGGAFKLLNGVARGGLGRLNADGSLDPNFNPVVTGGNASVYAVAPQPDGKICAGGSFTNVAGIRRDNFARLPATAFVSENWTWDGTRLTWLRQGPAAACDAVTLESSADGVTWQPLADGTRLPGAAEAWEFSGVSLPFSQAVRARGQVILSGAHVSQNVAVLKAPGIITQPASRTNRLGSIVGFYVAVEGQGPFAYQWYRDGAALEDEGPITGAHTPFLSFRVEDLPGGSYQVTVSNLFGSAISSAASLTAYDPATPPLILANEPAFGFYTNCFTFRIQGVPGQTCIVEQSDTMSAWMSISTNTLNSFTPAVFTDPSNPAATRFYRVRLQQ